MNPRERNLAIVVFGMLGVLGVWYAWSYITSGLDSREKEIDKLVDQLDDRQKKLAKAKQSENRLKSYKNRALPDDVEVGGLRAARAHQLEDRFDDRFGNESVVEIVLGLVDQQGIGAFEQQQW